MRYLVVVFFMLLIVTGPLRAEVSYKPADVQTLDWEQLIPENFSLDDVLDNLEIPDLLDDQDPKAQLYMDQMEAALNSAPVVPDMDKKLVKIPGFIVPVQSNGSLVSEFFLVPYFGACIHVPPPPSNQIIYVYYEAGHMLETMYDPVWIIGLLETETVNNDVAVSGYSLTAYAIEPYDEEEESDSVN